MAFAAPPGCHPERSEAELKDLFCRISPGLQYFNDLKEWLLSLGAIHGIIFSPEGAWGAIGKPPNHIFSSTSFCSSSMNVPTSVNFRYTAANRT